MPVFVDFLKTSGLWDGLIADCPLRYTSPNAPRPVEVLGTLLMSVRAGQSRYAHISGLRGDGVNPEWLAMRKVMSEDSARRAFKQASPEDPREWLNRHLRRTYEPLLERAWVLDLESTVKPLYGHQEKVVKGYNPVKPGRPSHIVHTYLLAQLRLVLGAEVQAGNQAASSYAQTGFWEYFATLPPASRPVFIRGDIGWGTERMMQEAEQRDQAYLFKVRQSAKIKELLAGSFALDPWQPAGQGWEGTWSEVRLAGWIARRRATLLRRPLREDQVAAQRKGKTRRRLAQLELAMDSVQEGTVFYEYAVLVTALVDDIFTLAQHYRDRGDAENNFDELKNQWGWLGFTTHEHARSELMTLFAPWFTTGGVCSRASQRPTRAAKRLRRARSCRRPSDAGQRTAISPR
jgi:hypothetical protein